MENYYQKVRDEFLEPAGLINKELTMGCLIRFKDKNTKAVYLCHSDNLGNYPRIDFINCATGKVSAYSVIEQYEILGHDYDLREVMQWLNKYPHLQMMMGGEIVKKEWRDGIYTDIFLCTMSLSVPLKDQDLKGLYELMKEVSK